MASNPIVIPPGFGQAALTFALSGSTRASLVILGFTDDPTKTPNAVATEISVAWAAGFPAADGEAPWLFLGTGLRVNRAGVIHDGVDNTSVTYAGVSGTVPPNCAFLVRKVTGISGKQNRGRMYFPPLFSPEGDITDYGYMGSADLAAVGGRMTTFFNALVTDALTPVILHHEFIRNPALPPPAMIPNPAAGTPTVVTAFQLQQQLATQRRRLRS